MVVANADPSNNNKQLGGQLPAEPTWNFAQINVQFRILLWLIISASLTMLQLVDLIVVSSVLVVTSASSKLLKPNYQQLLHGQD